VKDVGPEPLTIACIACGAVDTYPLWCQKTPEVHAEHAKVHRCRACAAKRGKVGDARPTGG
jgi:sulfur relay (sulfurtransferase) complex TusBCD TusD component (DsrE family)